MKINVELLYTIISSVYKEGDILKHRRNHKTLFTTILCFFIIGLSITSSLNNISKIREKRLEKARLTRRLEELKDEQKTLSDDVEKLKNPEYAARYAREKYLYSKNGEKILKID